MGEDVEVWEVQVGYCQTSASDVVVCWRRGDVRMWSSVSGGRRRSGMDVGVGGVFVQSGSAKS